MKHETCQSEERGRGLGLWIPITRLESWLCHLRPRSRDPGTVLNLLTPQRPRLWAEDGAVPTPEACSEG